MTTERGKREAGNIHSRVKIFRRGIEIAAFQLVLIREGNGVNKKIEFAPTPFDRFEQRLDRRVVRDVTGLNEIRLH